MISSRHSCGAVFLFDLDGAFLHLCLSKDKIKDAFYKNIKILGAHESWMKEISSVCEETADQNVRLNYVVLFIRHTRLFGLMKKLVYFTFK